MSVEPLPLPPATRALATVLRRQLAGARRGTRFLIGSVVAAPDAQHVTVSFQGEERTIPRLSSYAAPTAGRAVYCLADDTIVVALGEVAP